MIPAAQYQQEGCDFLAARRFALLADEMRVRKTRQAIMAAHKVGAQSLLAVCPAIGVPHWHAELERWWPSGPLPRVQVWSYDKARSMWQDGLKGSVDVFVPDECHFARNPEAARTRMVYGKTGFSRHAGYVWPLSGTPAPKHAAELWPMMKAFGVVGMTYDEFVRFYCTVNPETLRITGTKAEKIPELRALLAKFMLRRTRKQVAPEMPDISFEYLEMDLAQDIRFGSDDAGWLEENSGIDHEDRIAVAMEKAKHLANEIEFVFSNELLKQTVVFGWHKEPLRWLTSELQRRQICAALIAGDTPRAKREEYQQGFRDGTIQVINANIDAAGTAIDLSPASHGYFLELWWLATANLQAANRLISLDKAEPVTFDICTAPGSVDDRVQRVLVRRMKQIKELGLA